MSNLIISRVLAVFFLFFIFVSNTFAVCTLKSTITQHVKFGSALTVPANAGIGDVIGTASVPGTNDVMFSCTPGSYYYRKLTYLNGIRSSYPNTYQTNIPGIGFRSGSTDNDYENPANDVYYTSSETTNVRYTSGLTYELIKTGNIAAGTYNLYAGEATRQATDYSASSVAVYGVFDGVTVNVLPSNCSINNGQNIFIHFNETDRDDLTNSFSSAPASNTVTKTINFNCDDTNTHDFQASLVFDGAYWSSSDTVKTSNSNVGVNVLWNGKIMTAGKRIDFSFGGYGTSSMSFTLVKNSGVTNDQVSTGAFTASATLILNTP